MTRQEQAAYFKSKDYCGEQLKVVIDAISYGISADYLRLFEDTTIPVETMENMFTAMKEDYGVETVTFLSTVYQEESGRILLEEREETSKRIRELEAENKRLHEQLLIQQSYVSDLQEQQRMHGNSRLSGNRNTQENREVQDEGQRELKNSQTEKADYQRQNKTVGAETGKQTGILSSFSFPFIRKKPDLLGKLAGELDAGQIAEVRLGIEDIKSEFRLEAMLRMLIRLGIAQWLVANNLTILKAFFSSIGAMVNHLGNTTMAQASIGAEEAEIIENLGFATSLVFLILSVVLSLIILICGFFIIYTVYFRFLKIMVIVPLAAIAFSTLAGNRTVSTTCVRYFKYFLSVVMEAVTMALAILICNAFISAGLPSFTGSYADWAQVLIYLCEITFTIALTVGACKGAQSLTGRALGL